MHNRLSLVMMEETPRFKIEMTQDLYDKVRQIAFDIQSKVKGVFLFRIKMIFNHFQI